ncbi:hypothetical protein [Streptomyces sp. NPDC051738]|uniref:hypothetical protein n=1 Tax=Streptomyces sp. NPDC051738 TaxID=3365672 RepID=UPI0037CE125D
MLSPTKVPSGTPPASPVRKHPAYLELQRERAADVELRMADWIARFAGSMRFVYIHAVLFAGWMLWMEKSPWETRSR